MNINTREDTKNQEVRLSSAIRNRQQALELPISLEGEKKIREGDRALSILLRMYQPWIGVQIRQNKTYPAAEVVAACEEAIYQTALSYTPERSSFVSWLCWKFRAEIKDVERRHQKRILDQSADLEELDRFPSDEAPAIERAIAEFVYESILSLLDERGRSLVERRIRGFKFNEIGEDLGISPDAARVAYNRSIKKIQLNSSISFAS